MMELGPKSHSGDGLLGPDSILVVYLDPLGIIIIWLPLGALGILEGHNKGGSGIL